LISSRDQQIRALLRAALERPVADRASFVATLAGDDDELRTSVERLLSQHGATEVGEHVEAANAGELPAGAMLGQYRIEGVLGRGGMGIVYRARDLKLSRPVAIKFLAATIGDAELTRRFRQEAATASGLNHPHIVTVYDVGEHEGRQYIVSELVDGGTLEAWAGASRRSWRQIVELVTGVADGLAAAHSSGVLHRDVKPGNILIGGNGYAKLADFGLAKLVGPSNDSASSRPRTTRAGLVVGTVAYMSPEQAGGQALDARSDVFSFGIVLYELLAGRRPFDGKSDLGTLEAIAHAAPEPLPDSVPELLQIALDKALEKEPADRYQTMQDFAADLRRVLRKPTPQRSADAERRGRTSRLPWLVAAGLALALGTLVAREIYFAQRAAPSAAQMRFTIPVPGYEVSGLAISADGTQVSYRARNGDASQLWVRPLNAVAARPIPGTDNASGAFWSPNGRYLAFHQAETLKRVDVLGGPVQRVAAAFPLLVGGAWTRDDTILFTTPLEGSSSPRLARVSAGGGTATPVTIAQPSTDVLFQANARMLPDGEHFLYAVIPVATESAQIHVGSLTSDLRTPLLTLVAENPAVSNRVWNVAYADGFLLYLLDSTLVAHPFDTDELALRGAPIPVAQNVGEFAVSATGVLVYREWVPPDTGDAARTARWPWVDRRGQEIADVEVPSAARVAALSPDGTRVALSAFNAPRLEDIWIVDERGARRRLINDAATDTFPVWSPDGALLAFGSGRGAITTAPSRIYARATSGAGTDELLFDVEQDEFAIPWDWSRDGGILFARGPALRPAELMDLWVLPPGDDSLPKPLLQSPFVKKEAAFSPNGRFVAYVTNESGRDEVVVVPFPDVHRGSWPLSTNGGAGPRWRPDGREIYYLGTDGTIMAVDVASDGDVLEYGTPRPLFATGATLGRRLPGYVYFDTADGERFLINEPALAGVALDPTAPSAEPPITVIVNWSAGLGQ
jgi:serine/threonine protein kinase/Tol biopolymer transport system component